MNEKTIIEGKFNKKNPIVIALLILGIVGYIVGILVALHFSDGFTGHYDGWYYRDGFIDEFYTDFSMAGVYFHYGAILVFISCAIFYFMMNRCSLTITDKRVYGKANFGRRVDLPMNQISSVGLGFANSIAVATSSGKIQFWLLENKEDVHKALSDLIISQQKTESKTVEVKSSNADELKKYKDLLDSGVITQEEFDAKKKQILGL